jgi:arginine decarboxylase
MQFEHVLDIAQVDELVDLAVRVKDVLELHAPNGQEYILGVFITGAYQEILGDMHNLFGDTNAVHVHLEEDGGYRLEHLVKGDTTTEVLRFVQYDPDYLIARLRQTVEAAVRSGTISFEEAGQMLRKYERNLEGYTYLDNSEGGQRFF